MRIRVVALEFFDVADRRAAEGIDRLVGIAHHAQLALRLALARESRHQLVLCVVGVLVLVDHDVAEAAPVVLAHVRIVVQDRHDLTDQIVEVHRVRRPQAVLIRLVQRGDLGRVGVGIALRFLQRPGRAD